MLAAAWDHKETDKELVLGEKISELEPDEESDVIPFQKK